MSEFRKGEHVRATIEGPVTQDALGSLYIDAGDDVLTEVPKSAPRITIERLAPAEWPPRPGDLWRDRDGDLWFCRTWQVEGGKWRTGMVCARRVRPKSALLGGSLPEGRILADHGPLTLVHREDEQDGGAS